MTFEQYLALFMTRWKLIVVCFLVAGLGSYIGSKLMTPLYQSRVLVQITIHLGSNQTDYNSLLASEQLVQTEAQLAVSDPVLREVASHYPGLTSESLSKEVTSTPKLDTQLFEIVVLDPSPTRASDLANDVAATLIKQQLHNIQQSDEQSKQQILQDLVGTRQQIDSTAALIAAQQGQGGNKAQLNILQAQLASLQQHYSQWETALAQLELAQAESGDFLRVAQLARPALAPSYPNTLLNVGVGLLAGLFLGILLAILFERLDTRVRTPEDLTQLLGYPILGTVWHTRSAQEKEVVNPLGHDPNVESYRILRTNIGFVSIDKPLRFLMVTSAVPREGKSVIAANMAVFSARAGKSVLLIDADMRRPTQHEKFGISADAEGLSNAILAFSKPATVSSTSDPELPAADLSQQNSNTSASLECFTYATDIPNLSVMPSGVLPPNPPELLESKAMQRILMEIASHETEVVIIDSPPLLGLSDASILASKVDGMLLVVDSTQANKQQLKRVKAFLTQAGAHVLGCVMNKQRRTRKEMSFSYYYRTKADDSKERSTKNTGAPAMQ